jgi:transcriptional regulator with XRE-family HTH domain
MPDGNANPINTPWLAMRLASGLSQREVERRLGWEKRGHLSLIERGIPPSSEQARQLKALYAVLLTGEDRSQGDVA